ncbi:UvrB/UvrC motif-containing protein [Candidatus Palauibacter sp.]|uniref:UvrB/UvrC motif-containing protein n=1 Tax=Candidatus Palauibacter sp. TaxID=3101350 RepID=UPI003AF2436D
MDCENCGERKAKITLTEIEENEMRTVNLCSTCATLKGVSVGSGSPPIADLLAHLGGGAGDTLFEAGGEACEYCGTGAAEFRKSGRLGCPQCYVQFDRQLRALLRRVHGAWQHMGKVYVSTALDTDPAHVRLSTLRRRLERAVEIEDFESAADLRDEIHVLTEAS